MTAKTPGKMEFDLAFLDVETSGLDPVTHEILELAIVRCDSRTLEEKARLHRYFLPQRPVSEEAATINGYDRALWQERGATWMELADLDAFDAILEGAAFAGQVVEFDKRFLFAAYDELTAGAHGARIVVGAPAPRRRPEVDYHTIDIAVFGWPLVVGEHIEGMSLKHTRRWFGLPGEQTHTALGDVLDEIAVYKRFMEAYVAAWKVEAVTRENHVWDLKRARELGREEAMKEVRENIEKVAKGHDDVAARVSGYNDGSTDRAKAAGLRRFAAAFLT